MSSIGKIIVYLLVGISVALVLSAVVFVIASVLVAGLDISERAAFALSAAAVGGVMLLAGWQLDYAFLDNLL